MLYVELLYEQVLFHSHHSVCRTLRKTPFVSHFLVERGIWVWTKRLVSLTSCPDMVLGSLGATNINGNLLNMQSYTYNRLLKITCHARPCPLNKAIFCHNVILVMLNNGFMDRTAFDTLELLFPKGFIEKTETCFTFTIGLLCLLSILKVMSQTYKIVCLHILIKRQIL